MRPTEPQIAFSLVVLPRIRQIIETPQNYSNTTAYSIALVHFNRNRFLAHADNSPRERVNARTHTHFHRQKRGLRVCMSACWLACLTRLVSASARASEKWAPNLRFFLRLFHIRIVFHLLLVSLVEIGLLCVPVFGFFFCSLFVYSLIDRNYIDMFWNLKYVCVCVWKIQMIMYVIAKGNNRNRHAIIGPMKWMIEWRRKELVSPKSQLLWTEKCRDELHTATRMNKIRHAFLLHTLTLIRFIQFIISLAI